MKAGSFVDVLIKVAGTTMKEKQDINNLPIRRQHKKPYPRSEKTLRLRVRELVHLFGSYTTDDMLTVFNAARSHQVCLFGGISSKIVRSL